MMNQPTLLTSLKVMERAVTAVWCEETRGMQARMGPVASTMQPQCTQRRPSLSAAESGNL